LSSFLFLNFDNFGIFVVSLFIKDNLFIHLDSFFTLKFVGILVLLKLKVSLFVFLVSVFDGFLSLCLTLLALLLSHLLNVIGFFFVFFLTS